MTRVKGESRVKGYKGRRGHPSGGGGKEIDGGLLLGQLLQQLS